MLLCLGTALPAAGAGVCASPAELEALSARALQTTLMVAALSCAERDRYNELVTRHQSALSAHGRQLRAFFQRAYGAAGEAELDAFVTRLANEASRRSSRHHEAFCAGAAALFARAMTAPPEAWSTVPAATEVDGIGACTQEQAAAVDTAAQR